jgi:ribonuclease R
MGRPKKKGNLSQLVLECFHRQPNAKFNYKQVARKLGINQSESRKTIIKALHKLCADGKLYEESPGKFRLKHKTRHLQGQIDFTLSGAAYVRVDGLGEDIQVPRHKTGKALQGDIVSVKVTKQGHRRIKGEVIKVVERNDQQFTGVIELSKNFAFLIPDGKSNADFFVPLRHLNGAEDQQKVVARFVSWDEKDENPTAEVIQVIGAPGERESEMLGILANYGFPLSFPKAVLDEANSFKEELSTHEIKERRDFRKIPTFTIDPKDARDFDDALSFQKLDDELYEIGVHIADVSHYVKSGSALDQEAYKRATSVYLVDRVSPMLPERLSNELCSLRPNEQKRSYSCVFKIDQNANVKDYWIGRTVIESDRRFSYEEAQEIIEGKEGDFQDEIRELNRLAIILRERRVSKGAIAFDRTELRFELNEKKDPVGVYLKVAKEANKLIEEYMLLANRVVAAHIGDPKGKRKPRPFVYRVHDNPDLEKLAEFVNFIKRFGYEMNIHNINEVPKALNDLLAEVAGKKEEDVISLMAIRSMAKAVYTTENIGHFGLHFDFYTHFTSPIRRYPDVMVHRLLTQYATGATHADVEHLEDQCEHSSDQERKAADAERDSTKYYQVLYIQNRVGQVFDGVVTGITEWGIFIEMIENKCEGMIRIKDLDDDYYYFDEKSYSLKAHNSGNEIHLGDKMKVRVTRADVVRKQIDMQLVESVED